MGESEEKCLFFIAWAFNHLKKGPLDSSNGLKEKQHQLIKQDCFLILFGLWGLEYPVNLEKLILSKCVYLTFQYFSVDNFSLLISVTTAFVMLQHIPNQKGFIMVVDLALPLLTAFIQSIFEVT